MKKDSYLLIDYGNSYIKACLYDKTHNKIIESVQTPKTINSRKLLVLFKYLSRYQPNTIIESITSISEYVKPFNHSLSKAFPKAKIKIVTKSDFKGLIDLSSISPDVSIGTDILVLAYYIAKTIKTGAICSLGTVYTCVVCKNKKIINCYFVPSMSKSLKTISSITSIHRDYIPEEYNTNKGVDTTSCFAVGAYFAISGWLKKIIENNKISSKYLLLTGGDVYRFPNLKKEYKEKKDLILLGLTMLVKEKHW